MGKYITLGEIMLRLTPRNFERLVQTKELELAYGGGEVNVAVALATYGKEAYFVTKLPENELGQGAIHELRRYGVNTHYVCRGGERIGIYYLERGASQRSFKVLYDRAYSAMAEAREKDFDWEAIFRGAEWFHFTGITPALSDKCIEITMEALKAAKKENVMISMDLNYRSKLWDIKKAGKVLSEMAHYCDLLIANEMDAEKLLGIPIDEAYRKEGQIVDEGYQDIAQKLMEKYKVKYVASTQRENFSASQNGWSALLYEGNKLYKSQKYHMHIVDRVGGGDAFAAGMIYGLSSGMGNQQALEFAAAASCLKHTIEGDFNLVSVEEIEALAKGDRSGRVQR